MLRRPAHVSLLDYEIELALVFRRAIQSPVSVTRETLQHYVVAACIANDVSARDVQLPQMQFFKGKSYRTFCPLGPWLTVLEPSEFALLDNLDLELRVNRGVRQNDTTANLVFKPWETISELSTFANVAPGDVLLTGTPSGCALTCSTARGAAACSTAPGAHLLAPLCQVAKPPPGISQSRRQHYGNDPQRRWAARPWRAKDHRSVTRRSR